jgi:thiol-disulfide isomerase/thioredoxin
MDYNLPSDMKLSILLTGLVICTAAVGCAPAPIPSSAATGPAAEAPTAAGAESAPAPQGQHEPALEESSAPAALPQNVELLVTDWAGVEGLIADHAGKVVIVDLWSTSCIPCRREFPHLVELHRDPGDRVACISVSTDYDGIPSRPVESYRPAVLEFLTSQQATFQNVLASVPAEKLFDQLKIGSIPTVFVYDQKGQRVRTFAEPIEGQEFTYAANIRPSVEALLAGTLDAATSADSSQE